MHVGLPIYVPYFKDVLGSGDNKHRNRKLRGRVEKSGWLAVVFQEGQEVR